MMLLLRSLAMIAFLIAPTLAYSTPAAPRVLLVVAHPDDEYFYAATTYRIVRELGGTVDQLVLTDGSGGYRYSLLAQPFYEVNLTDPAVAAKKLAEIRRRELMDSGKILGIHEHTFLNYPDQRTKDLEESIRLWGGKEKIKATLKKAIQAHQYDFVFTQLPSEKGHEHHQATTILTLEAIRELPVESRPALLGASVRTEGESAEDQKKDDPSDSRQYTVFQKNDLTRVKGERLSFDRAMKFGFNETLNYRIVVNWMIAAHKSQGAFQNYFNLHRYEDFRIFALNSDSAAEKAKELFQRLAGPTKNASFQVASGAKDKKTATH